MSAIFGKPKVDIINCLQEISAKFAFGRKDVGNDQGFAGGNLIDAIPQLFQRRKIQLTNDSPTGIIPPTENDQILI